MIRLGVLSMDHPHAAGNHFPSLRYIQHHVKVAAIAHHSYNHCKPWLEQFGAEYLPSAEELLARSDIDAVLITSRNCCHAQDSIAAAAAGKDIFCDKPIATNSEDVRSLVRAVRKAGVRFITTFPLRFNTSIRRLKQMIQQGKLGHWRAFMATNHGCMYEPGGPEWIRDPAQSGGGSLIDHTVHVADIIRWLTGAEFQTVRAETATAFRDIKSEDVAVLHGELTDGSLYQIDATWSRRAHHPMWGDVTFRLVGTEGTANLDLYNLQRIEIYNHQLTTRYPNHICREHGEIFLDYVATRRGGKPSTNADEIDGLRTIELVLAAYESAQKERTVTVEHWLPD